LSNHKIFVVIRETSTLTVALQEFHSPI